VRITTPGNVEIWSLHCNPVQALPECRSETRGPGYLSSAALLHWSAGGCGVTGMVGLKSSKAIGSDWQAMMTAAQAGDAAVYRALLAELAGWLRRYYLSRLPPPMVEDAVQDVLLAVHEKRHTYDPSRPFGPWLAAIARYKWIDHIRALKSDTTLPLDENIGVADHGEAVMAGAALSRVLGDLKPAQAEVIRLVKIEGYSIEEASKTTGQSVSLVKVNIHRGLKRLASLLRKTNDAD
jgi:RNA polymerase sigma factor (sigma-70 family)